MRKSKLDVEINILSDLYNLLTLHHFTIDLFSDSSILIFDTVVDKWTVIKKVQYINRLRGYFAGCNNYLYIHNPNNIPQY